MAPDELRKDLQRWVDAELIAPEQAAAIRRHEGIGDTDTQEDQPGDSPSAAAEVTGYVGAALALSAAALIVSEYWERLTDWGQVTLMLLVTTTLLAAGAVLRNRTGGPAWRLVNVLWAAGVIAVLLTVGLAVENAIIDPPDRFVAAVVTGAGTTVAAILYLERRTTPQQIAVGFSTAAFVLSLLATPKTDIEPFFFGLALWGLGVVWLLLGHGGWIRPAMTADVLGVLALGVGSQIAVVGDLASLGFVLALGSTAAVLALGTRHRSLLWMIFGVAGTLLFVPQAVFHFFGDTLGAPLALLVTGLLLIIGAVGLVPLRSGDDGASQ